MTPTSTCSRVGGPLEKTSMFDGGWGTGAWDTDWSGQTGPSTQRIPARTRNESARWVTCPTLSTHRAGRPAPVDRFIIDCQSNGRDDLAVIRASARAARGVPRRPATRLERASVALVVLPRPGRRTLVLRRLAKV